MNKKKRFYLPVILLLAGVLCTGCGIPESARVFLEDTGLVNKPAPADYSHVTGELDAEYVEFPQSEGYYILHDGLYYGMAMPDWYDDETYAEDLYNDDVDSLQARDHRLAMMSEYDTYIPTLYVDNGDKLIYYSDTYILDCYVLAKLWDLGYSVPITTYEETTGGYIYLMLSTENESDPYTNYMLPSAMKDMILSQPVMETEDAFATLRIYSVNGTEITSDYIRDGLLKGLERDVSYQFNGAFGTENFQWTAKAEYHYFMEGELYAEAEYEAAYDGTYVIDPPPYLTSGYYLTDNGCMFRLVTSGDSYDMYNTDSAQFNTRQLGFDEEWALENGGTRDEDGRVQDAEGMGVTNNRSVYSNNPQLCFYTTRVPDMLGYVPEEPVQEAGSQVAGGREQGTEEADSAIDTLRVSYYRILPNSEEKLKIPAGETLYELSSTAEGDAAPCMIRQLSGNTLTTVPSYRSGEQYIYAMQTEQGITLSAEHPVYLALYDTEGAELRFTSLAEGCTIETVPDTTELPESLINDEESRRRQ